MRSKTANSSNTRQLSFTQPSESSLICTALTGCVDSRVLQLDRPNGKNRETAAVSKHNHKPSTSPKQTITSWKRLQSNTHTHTHKPVLPRALIPSPLVGSRFGVKSHAGSSQGATPKRPPQRRILSNRGRPERPRYGAPWRGWAVPGQRNQHLASVRLQYVQQRERFGRGRANDGACGCGEGWVSCSSIFSSDDLCAPDGSPCFCCPTAVAGRSLSMVRSYGLVSCFVDE